MNKKEVFQSFFKTESYKTAIWFLLKTIFFFIVLNYTFKFYTGLTIEGGKLYSRFLAEHFDLIGFYRTFLLWGGGQFAALLGYSTYYTDYYLVIRGGASVQLVYSCLGFDLISAYMAFVLAWPAKQSHKVVSALVGTGIIVLINMVRLGGLVVLYATRNNRFFNYIDHHDLFNIVMLVIVLLMFAVHVRYSLKAIN